MRTLYYKIWADLISVQRAKKGSEGGWKLFALVMMSVLQGVNLLAILLLLRIISGGRLLVIFPMSIFKTTGFNTGISVLVSYILPFIIINYLLVFYNQQYVYIEKQYFGSKGKLFRNYALISIGMILIPLLLKIAFFS